MKTAVRIGLALAVAISCGEAWAQEQVLVLADGGVLTGQISRDGQTYVVTRGGGEIRIAAARVLVACGSLEEAYDHRRQKVIRPTADSHLGLAEWCLRYRLTEPARREMEAARALDPMNPRLALMERRVVHASRESKKPADAESAAEKLRPPAGESPAPIQAAATEVSPRVVERFTRKVQPVLVNTCTASGCHQPGGEHPFQLDRSLLHGLANRRSTMNNLAAALALIDRERPQESPLLTVPRAPHGGMEEPVFGPRQEQAFKHLVEWVALVTHADASPSPAPTIIESAADTDSLATELEEPTLLESPELTIAPASPRVQFGAQVEKWQPRDEFDPEIFNRQQSARQSAATRDDSDAQPAGL